MDKNEKRIVFDKNFIEGAGYQDINFYNKFPYKPLILPGLQYEILGNLTKNDKRYIRRLEKNKQTPQQFTSRLLKKIQDISISDKQPSCLIREELSGMPIKIKHDFFGFGISVGVLEIFEGLISEQIKKWAKEKFSKEDYESSKRYRAFLTNKQIELKKLIPQGDIKKFISFLQEPSKINCEYNAVLNKWVEYHLLKIITPLSEAFKEVKKKLLTQPLASLLLTLLIV